MAGTRPGRPSIAGGLELVLDPLDQALGPQQLLLAVVHGQQCRVAKGQEADALAGGLVHGRPLAAAGGQHRPLEPRLVGLAPGGGDQPQALHMRPAEPGQPDPVEDPAGQAVAQQRHHRQLVLPHRLVGADPREPHRLQDRDQRVQRDPGLLAHLPVGPRRAHRPAAERRALEEGERQPAGPDGRGDPLHGQPGLLARHRQADLGHVALPERAGALPGDQDAQLDQPLDLGLGRAGEVGQPRRRQPAHAARGRGYSAWGPVAAGARSPSPAGGSSETVS